MKVVVSLCQCVFSVVMLLAIYFSGRKINDAKSLNSRLISVLLLTTIVMLIANFLANPESPVGVYSVKITGHLILLLLNPVMPITWFLYVDNQVYSDDLRTLRIGRVFTVYLLLNAVLVLISLSEGWYFRVDPAFIFKRGPLFPMPGLINMAFLLAVVVLLLLKRKRIEPGYFHFLMISGLPPLIAGVLQILVDGTFLVLYGVVVSLVLMYINTQNRRMNVDYLTGAFNRSQLDYFLTDKIRRSAGAKTFSAIFLDLDDFKTINDRFGHNTGDDALKTLVLLLKKSVRRSDFVARFGGDEFFVVTDLTKESELELVADRIRQSLKEFNCTGQKPYRLSLSMGYLVYDCAEHVKAEDFLVRIDRLMYAVKGMHKTSPPSVQSAIS